VASPHILIVDDEVAFGEMLRQLLEGEGYRVDVVRDVAAAKAAVATAVPDLLLLDVMLPEVDGLTFFRSLKADPATKRLPIVLMSAAHARLAELEGQGIRVLRKPFSIAALFAVVHQILPLE
jgi:DNA-binding response OmpR family regulator